MKSKFFLLTIVFSATALIARANNTTPCNGEENRKSDIAGGVVHADTKKPVGNVSVTAYTVAKKEKVVYTDANGNYAFNELKGGTYKLVFEKDGFRKVTRDKVIIRPDGGTQLNVEMDKEEELRLLPGSFFDFN